MKNKKVLAVIPVRGGSKGIPRKNLRLMGGQPLFLYSVENAGKCPYITDFVITTDDEEIIGIAQMYGIEYIERDASLAADDVPLDPVIYDAVIKTEKKHGYTYDIVVTLQATSPLLSQETLTNALADFFHNDFDTCISTQNRPHLAWQVKDGKFVPAYTARVNRQQLPAYYTETGAFLISNRTNVTAKTRIGEKITIYEVPEKEAVDIDSINDWQLCEDIINRKRIMFRCDGEKKLGMGHIYRCMTLAYSLTGHEIIFILDSRKKEGIKKIQESFFPYHLIDTEDDFYHFADTWNADIIINDCLDTDVDYMQALRRYTKKIVNFEDLGFGAELADVVINALYDSQKNQLPYYFSGEKYICLRDEFQLSIPKQFSPTVKNILVMFGGTDPCNLTQRIYELARKNENKYSDIQYTFILGSGYENNNKIVSDGRIKVLTDVKRISDHMKAADLAITSQGRTVYELAVLGIPAIVLAQNQREQLHTFAQMKNGFINLGLGSSVSDSTIEFTLEWMIKTPQVRQEMQTLMLSHDLKSGLKRVIRLILDENINDI